MLFDNLILLYINFIFVLKLFIYIKLFHDLENDETRFNKKN